MRWFDLISSIIFSFSPVHTFNSSYLNEFPGPMEPLSPFVCVNEICGFGGRELRSELQRDCAVTGMVSLGNTQICLSFVLKKEIKESVFLL